jgi:hypothetical protein
MVVEPVGKTEPITVRMTIDDAVARYLEIAGRVG